jgi:ribosomal protein S20
MPNIKQQEKRVRTAQRERAENIRFRSTVKTLTKRLQVAVEEGDAEKATQGALHANTAARKKAQAARLVAAAS